MVNKVIIVELDEFINSCVCLFFIIKCLCFVFNLVFLFSFDIGIFRRGLRSKWEIGKYEDGFDCMVFESM